MLLLLRRLAVLLGMVVVVLLLLLSLPGRVLVVMVVVLLLGMVVVVVLGLVLLLLGLVVVVVVLVLLLLLGLVLLLLGLVVVVEALAAAICRHSCFTLEDVRHAAFVLQRKTKLHPVLGWSVDLILKKFLDRKGSPVHPGLIPYAAPGEPFPLHLPTGRPLRSFKEVALWELRPDACTKQVGVLIGRHELLGRVLQATWAHLRGQNREPAKLEEARHSPLLERGPETPDNWPGSLGGLAEWSALLELKGLLEDFPSPPFRLPPPFELTPQVAEEGLSQQQQREAPAPGEDEQPQQPQQQQVLDEFLAEQLQSQRLAEKLLPEVLRSAPVLIPGEYTEQQEDYLRLHCLVAPCLRGWAIRQAQEAAMMWFEAKARAGENISVDVEDLSQWDPALLRLLCGVRAVTSDPGMPLEQMIDVLADTPENAQRAQRVLRCALLSLRPDTGSGGGADSPSPTLGESDSQGAGAWARPGAELSVAARLLLALLHGDFVESLAIFDLRDTLLHMHLEASFEGEGRPLVLGPIHDRVRRLTGRFSEWKVGPMRQFSRALAALTGSRRCSLEALCMLAQAVRGAVPPESQHRCAAAQDFSTPEAAITVIMDSFGHLPVGVLFNALAFVLAQLSFAVPHPAFMDFPLEALCLQLSGLPTCEPAAVPPAVPEAQQAPGGAGAARAGRQAGSAPAQPDRAPAPAPTGRRGPGEGLPPLQLSRRGLERLLAAGCRAHRGGGGEAALGFSAEAAIDSFVMWANALHREDSPPQGAGGARDGLQLLDRDFNGTQEGARRVIEGAQLLMALARQLTPIIASAEEFHGKATHLVEQLHKLLTQAPQDIARTLPGWQKMVCEVMRVAYLTHATRVAVDLALMVDEVVITGAALRKEDVTASEAVDLALMVDEAPQEESDEAAAIARLEVDQALSTAGQPLESFRASLASVHGTSVHSPAALLQLAAAARGDDPASLQLAALLSRLRQLQQLLVRALDVLEVRREAGLVVAWRTMRLAQPSVTLPYRPLLARFAVGYVLGPRWEQALAADDKAQGAAAFQQVDVAGDAPLQAFLLFEEGEEPARRAKAAGEAKRKKKGKHKGGPPSAAVALAAQSREGASDPHAVELEGHGSQPEQAQHAQLAAGPAEREEVPGSPPGLGNGTAHGITMQYGTANGAEAAPPAASAIGSAASVMEVAAPSETVSAAFVATETQGLVPPPGRQAERREEGKNRDLPPGLVLPGAAEGALAASEEGRAGSSGHAARAAPPQHSTARRAGPAWQVRPWTPRQSAAEVGTNGGDRSAGSLEASADAASAKDTTAAASGGGGEQLVAAPASPAKQQRVVALSPQLSPDAQAFAPLQAPSQGLVAAVAPASRQPSARPEPRDRHRQRSSGGRGDPNPGSAASTGERDLLEAAKLREPKQAVMERVVAAAQAMLTGRQRAPAGGGHTRVVWYNGAWDCHKCGTTHLVEQKCPFVNPPCRAYLMGYCSAQGNSGCGQAHPTIELDSDSFPEDLPWQEVVVLPPGALQGKQAAQWRQLLQKHAALTPEAALEAAMGVAVASARALLADGAGQPQQQVRQQQRQQQQGQRQQEAQHGVPAQQGQQVQQAQRQQGVTRAQRAPAPGRPWDRRWDPVTPGRPASQETTSAAAVDAAAAQKPPEPAVSALAPAPPADTPTAPGSPAAGQRPQAPPAAQPQGAWAARAAQRAAAAAAPAAPAVAAGPPPSPGRLAGAAAAAAAAVPAAKPAAAEVEAAAAYHPDTAGLGWVDEASSLGHASPRLPSHPGASMGTTAAAPAQPALAPAAPGAAGPSDEGSGTSGGTGSGTQDGFPALVSPRAVDGAGALSAAPASSWAAIAGKSSSPWSRPGALAAAGRRAGEQASTPSAAASPVPVEKGSQPPGGEGEEEVYAWPTLPGNAAATPPMPLGAPWQQQQQQQQPQRGWAPPLGPNDPVAWHTGAQQAQQAQHAMPEQPHWALALPVEESLAGSSSLSPTWQQPSHEVATAAGAAAGQWPLPTPNVVSGVAEADAESLPWQQLLSEPQPLKSLTVQQQRPEYLGLGLGESISAAAAAPAEVAAVEPSPWLRALQSQAQPPRQPLQQQAQQQWQPAVEEGSEEDEHLSLLQLMGVGSEEAEAAAGSPAGAAGTAGASMWRSVLTQQQRASAKDELGATAGVTGLSNEAGEFNCFVNVVIQCLWRCEGFRQQVLGWPAELHQGDAVVSALHGLFAQLESQEQEQHAAQQAPHAQRSVVNPNPLREALSALPQGLFTVGEMSDAGEVLLTLVRP
ncbi:hypothetical protein N2152v2_008137 [Parachlorella kessleri]